MKKIRLFIIAFTLIGFSIQLNAQSFKVPAFEKFKLKNGLTVYLVEQHEVPITARGLSFCCSKLTSNLFFSFSNSF